MAIPVGIYAWLRFDIGWHGYWFQLAYWLRNNPDQTLHLLIVIIVTPAVLLGAILGLQAYAYRLFTRSQWEVYPAIQPLIRTLVNERIFATTVEHLAVLRVLRAGGAIALIVAGVWVSGISFMRVFHSESVQASHGCSTATSITANTTWPTNQCLGDVTITNGATLTIAGNTSHQLSSLTLGDGSTNGFITAQGDTVNGVGVTLTVDGNVEVKSGSSISANGQGYTVGNGPGTGSGSGRGGSYGGQGFVSTGTSGEPYGLAMAPVSLGSGGASYAGGGAIKINIDGNLTHNGAISADGAGACGSCAGGGSGGSVWINFTGGTSAWSGSGTIKAGATWHGGGGRVAVTGYVTDTHSGSVNAYTTTNPGAPGTVYLKSSSQTNGALTVDNNGVTLRYNELSSSNATYTKPGSTSLTLDSLTIQGKGELLIPDGISVTIASGGSYTVTASSGTSTMINQGTLTLASGVSVAGNSSGISRNEGTFTFSGTHTISSLLIQRGTLSSAGSTITVASGGTLRIDAATTLGDVTVQSGGDIDHSDNSTAETYKMDLTVTNLTVDSGGTINANELGYNAGSGPGVGGTNSAGSYGGMGVGDNSGSTYGSLTAPVNVGSGGVVNGGTGGGAIKLTISGDLTNNGTISANGSTTSTSNYNGGSGGSVWVNFTGGSSTWSGSGSITANGGTPPSSGARGGGGGRVAVTGYSSSAYSGSTVAYGGAYGIWTTTYAAPGTVYMKSATQANGTLVIDNNSKAPVSGKYAKSDASSLTLDVLTIQNNGTYLIPSASSLAIVSGGSYTVSSSSGNATLVNQGTLTLASGINLVGNGNGITQNEGTLSLGSTHTLSHVLIQRGMLTPTTTTVTIASGGTLRVDAATGLGDVTVQSGGDIDHSDNSTAETYKMDLSVANLTVDTGGTINVNELGYDAGSGPGVGGTNSAGSYGGMGVGGSSGSTYGSLTAPSNLGSGAVSGGSSGGGAIKLTVSGNLTNNGTISANGSTTTTSNYNGGSGGSVWINFTGGSSTWSGSGSITANGGTPISSGAYGGGGGRVAVTGYASSEYSGDTVAYGGAYTIWTTSYAAPGTVYMRLSSQTNGTLTIDNNGKAPVSGKYARTNVTSLALDGLTVRNQGTYIIPAGAAVAIASGGSITHSASSTILNQGTFTSTGVIYTISGTFTADGTTNFGTVTIASGGKINHSDNSAAETYKATVTATTMTVASGGLIDVNSLGFDGGAADTAGSGTGAGSAGGASSGGGGAGHGGAGGTGAGASGGSGGTTYGSTTEPVTIGSGGGGGDSVGGGAGGGAVKITISGNLTVAGTIRANGSNGTSSTYGGGGGAGGSIWLIIGGNMNCTGGTVTANGGNGAGSTAAGGGGAGGRLVRDVTGTYTACTTFTAAAGTGGTGAAAGTSYVPAPAPTGLTANPVTTTSITWGFADASTTETAFRLYNASHGLAGSVASSTTADTGTSYQISETTLSPNTAYTRYVVAYDGTANGTPSANTTVYTLANTPGAPTVNGATTSTLTVIIAINSNPAGTEFAIFNDTTDEYVQADGSLGASAAWQTYASWGGASGRSVSGLSPNTTYTFQVKARNGDNAETSLSSGASAYTLANVPGAPTLSGAEDTSVTVVIDVNSNPAATQFAVFEDTTDQYVQADGSLGASAAWQTYASWGSASGESVTGLIPNTSYTFQVKARNGESTETALSSSVSGYTLAAVPGALTLSGVGSTSLTLTVSANGNSSVTNFAIYESASGTYLQADGTLGATVAWRTYTDWGASSGSSVTGLTPNTGYTFKTKARNAESTETLYSSDSNATTLAVTPTVESVEAISDTAIRVKIDPGTNPSATLFAIYNDTAGLYLQTSGTLGASAAWQTYADWGGTTGMANTGLTAATTYTYKVKARNSEGNETGLSVALSTATAAATSVDTASSTDTSSNNDSSDDRADDTTSSSTASPTPSPSPSELVAATSEETPDPSVIATTTEESIATPEVVSVARSDAREAVCGFVENLIARVTGQACADEATESGGTVCLAFCERPISKVSTLVKSATVLPLASLVTSVVYLGVQGLSLFANYLRRIWYYFLVLLALRKPAKHRGKVINSVTGEPINLAMVIIYDKRAGDKMLPRVITDPDGSFPCDLSPGEYVFSVFKPGYNYPTRRLENVYRGEPVTVKGDEKFTVTLYCDPMGNQPPVVVQRALAMLTGAKRLWVPFITVGVVSSLVLFVREVTLPNAYPLAVYGAAMFVTLAAMLNRKHILTVVDKETGKRVPGAGIYLIRPSDGVGVLNAHANPEGQFMLKAPMGRYTMQVVDLSSGRITEQLVDLTTGRLEQEFIVKV